jgi:hypothetical protein
LLAFWLCRAAVVVSNQQAKQELEVGELADLEHLKEPLEETLLHFQD